MSFGLDAYDSSSDEREEDDNGRNNNAQDDDGNVKSTANKKRRREEEEEEIRKEEENAPVLFETRLPPPSSSAMKTTEEREELRKRVARKRFLNKQQKKLMTKSKGGGRDVEDEENDDLMEDEEERRRRDVLANAKRNGSGSGLGMFLPKPAIVDAFNIRGDFHEGGGFGSGGGTRIDLSSGTATKSVPIKTQEREQNEKGAAAVASTTIHPSQLYEVDDDGNYIHQELIGSMQQQQQQQQQQQSAGGNEQEKTSNNTMSLEDMLVKSNKMVEITEKDIRGSYNPLLANEYAIQNTNDMGGSLGKVSGTARAKNQVTSLVHDARQAELKLAQQQGMRHRTMAKSKYGW